MDTPQNAFFSFQFTPTSRTDDVPMFSGHGFLQIFIENDPVWGDKTDGIDGYWDSLLEHLANAWPFLQSEQIYPLGFNPDSPNTFLDDALAHLCWDQEPDEKLAHDEQDIFAFAERHNLASGLQDLHLSSICLLREGNEMRIVSEMHDVRMPIDLALAQLKNLGETIAHSVDDRSPRGKIILDAWNQRDQPLEQEKMLSIVMGIRPERLRSLAANDDLSTLFGQPSIIQSPTPMQIAARMTHHALFDDELLHVINKVSELKMTPIGTQLINLQRDVVPVIARAYDQGYQLAQWLRKKLDIKDDQPVNPEKLLKEWGVYIGNTKCSEVMDAIARWEENKIGILINKNGKRARTDWGRRASLAHEIAHLLLDTQHTLPSVEILGGRMPLHVERRANAFAAEFLLPRSHVNRVVPQSPTPNTLKPILEKLSTDFSVGQILTARQIENLLKERGQLDHPCKIYLERLTNRYSDNQQNDWLSLL
ncbi:MAG: ImmA/IrrE family metallo-endopeptidase [Magnetococcales bacterium]|nr:ImmA/IrrE family metallo-endopeptidase [Magnetococcales bacterium]